MAKYIIALWEGEAIRRFYVGTFEGFDENFTHAPEKFKKMVILTSK